MHIQAADSITRLLCRVVQATWEKLSCPIPNCIDARPNRKRFTIGCEEMNRKTKFRSPLRWVYRLMLARRLFAGKQCCNAFGQTKIDYRRNIDQIVVINLDRQTHRWTQMQRELKRIRDQENKPLIEMTSRFSAVDAKCDLTGSAHSVLTTSYALEDQLYVEPQPLLESIGIEGNQQIVMSQQEQAIALSHVEVWKTIARGSKSYVLVVEDDVYFTRRFSSLLDDLWADLIHNDNKSKAFDLLYLSFEEAKGGAEKEYLSEYLLKPRRGLWNMSGYVLSKEGAKKLVSLLPVRGPVDLWINHQFSKLGVFASMSSLIDQRRDYGSSNSYSVLPVLSKVGVLTEEGPAKFERNKLPGPVFGIGLSRTGAASLAMALSMLGYRCCSDLDELPTVEDAALFAGSRKRIFEAYVNVASVNKRIGYLTELYRHSRIIITVRDEGELVKAYGKNVGGMGASRCTSMKEADGESKMVELIEEIGHLSVKYLILSFSDPNAWQRLCSFLECEAPVSEFPRLPDQPQRRLSLGGLEKCKTSASFKRLKFDSSPWIAGSSKAWKGIPMAAINDSSLGLCMSKGSPDKERGMGIEYWKYLDDTFPSNMALFRPGNFFIENGHCGILNLRKEEAYVRNYTSAAISSRQRYLYGKFDALIKPAAVPGVITGMFLHRSSPRQEIDIEFLGRDSRRMLVNVFYNPGIEGSKYDYGYRGTPILIDLGFDAAKDFHQYSIEWSATYIRWFVDGRLVHQRSNWEPTPIPHLPMQLYINLWASRSRELAGRLAEEQLPTRSFIQCVEWCAWPAR